MSIKNPIKTLPNGHAIAKTAAIHDADVLVIVISLSDSFSWGIRIAEYAIDAPIDMLEEYTTAAAIIYKN